MPREDRERELHESTVEQLQDRARDLDITGRSSMRKDELVSAIAEAEGDAPPGVDALAPPGGDRDEPLAQMTPRGRRSSKVIWGAIGVLIIAAIAVLVVLWFVNDDSSAGRSDVGATKATSSTSYTLVSARSEGALGEVQASNGTFVLVTLTVSDESPAQGLLGGPAVQLRGGDGVIYAPAADATKALGSASLAAKSLEPGVPIEGEVGFDVPEAAIDGAQLIGRDLSGGTGEVTFDLGLTATAP